MNEGRASKVVHGKSSLIRPLEFSIVLPTSPPSTKVETPIHDNIRELVTWECKEHGVKS
jgi:hypothetical protein